MFGDDKFHVFLLITIVIRFSKNRVIKIFEIIKTVTFVEHSLTFYVGNSCRVCCSAMILALLCIAM